MTWRKREIMEMAREAGLRSAVLLHMYGKESALCDSEIEELRQLERFAELVREEAIAETNARANASWSLMCEKMLAIEREACAKVCEKHGYDHYCGNVTDKIAKTIRARGQA